MWAESFAGLREKERLLGGPYTTAISMVGVGVNEADGLPLVSLLVGSPVRAESGRWLGGEPLAATAALRLENYRLSDGTRAARAQALSCDEITLARDRVWTARGTSGGPHRRRQTLNRQATRPMSLSTVPLYVVHSSLPRA